MFAKYRINSPHNHLATFNLRQPLPASTNRCNMGGGSLSLRRHWWLGGCTSHPRPSGVARRWWQTAPPSLPHLTTLEREIISRERLPAAQPLTHGTSPLQLGSGSLQLLVHKESILRERERHRTSWNFLFQPMRLPSPAPDPTAPCSQSLLSVAISVFLSLLSLPEWERGWPTEVAGGWWMREGERETQTHR